MSNVDRLVSVLSAHLDKVEQDECGKRKLRVGYGDEDYCPTCGTWVDHVFGGKFNACGCPVPGEWWEPNPDEERLGLVRATRDLIEAWRAAQSAVSRLEARYTATAASYSGAEWGVQEALIQAREQLFVWGQAVSVAARGWGVTDDKEDRDG